MSVADVERPPLYAPRLQALRKGLIGTPLNAMLTVLVIAFLAWVLPPLLRWTVFDATWTGTARDCAANAGACWAFIGNKLRFILFAFYPPELQWRPLLVVVALLALLSATAFPRFWTRWLLAAWPVVIIGSWLLMAGVLLPPRVPVGQWGGLPITLFVWAVCFALATPLAVLLALARQSRLGGVRTLAIGFIEVMRATPMVAILYIAMLILPMALPGGGLLDKNLRAIIMITLFWSAYVAEVIRAGLQAIPPGQAEGAASLGLGYWRTAQLIILPQAFRLVIPGLVNLAIGFLLATSLLAVIGVFDLLNAAKASAADPQWLGFYDEAYFLVAAIYFVLCFGGSRYSRWLENYLHAERRK